MQIFLYRLFPQNAAASDGIPRFLLRFHKLHVGDAGLGLDVGDVGAGGVRAEVGSCILCGYASGDHSFTTFRTADDALITDQSDQVNAGGVG